MWKQGVSEASSRHTKAADAYYRSTGWADQIGEVVDGDKQDALVQETYRDTEFDGVFLRSNVSDTKLSYRFQFNHDWDWTKEEDVGIHFHLEPQANPASTEVLYFRGAYVWLRYGVATPPLSGWTTWTRSININPGDAFIPRVYSMFRASIPSWASDSSILRCYVIRDIGVDTYTTAKSYGTGAANVLADSIDAHYWRGKEGSKLEYTPPLTEV